MDCAGASSSLDTSIETKITFLAFGLGPERLRQRRRIVTDHVEIGGSRTVGAGERAGIESTPDRGARFIRDLFQQALVGDVLDDDG